MNVLSLFDGISCGRVALERAGIKVDKYYASEIDKRAMHISSKNYPDIVQLGDVNNWKNRDIDFGSIDLLFAGFPCFVAGTKVQTKDGIKNIEDVNIGDFVVTHENRLRQVINKQKKTSNYHCVVRAQGTHKILCTSEHPFYVRKCSRVRDNSKRAYTKSLSSPERKECALLQKGDYLGIPINTSSKDAIFNSAPAFWYMIGRYVADGYSSTENMQARGDGGYRRSYKTIITCGHQDEDVLEKIISEAGYNYNKSNERTAIKFIITSKELWEFVQPFGRGADKKCIPQFVIDMNKILLESFLNGYLSGDGDVGKYINNEGNRKHKITSVSLDLIYAVQVIVNKLYGSVGTICQSHKAGKCCIEGRICNNKDCYTISFHKGKQKQSRFIQDGDYLRVPFNTMDIIEESCEVYNIEVGGDNSYTANNIIVHNCQSRSLAGKQGGIEDPRGQLMYQMLHILEHIRTQNPNVKFLFENVVMKKEFLEFVNKEIGVEPIYINSSLLSAQSRKRMYRTNIEGVVQPEDKGILLKDILGAYSDNEVLKYDQYDKVKGLGAKYSFGGYILKDDAEKYGTLTASYGRITGNSGKIKCKEGYRILTPEECEKLQTLDIGYTEGISRVQRYKTIGNGRTVNVVAHILKFL